MVNLKRERIENKVVSALIGIMTTHPLIMCPTQTTQLSVLHGPGLNLPLQALNAVMCLINSLKCINIHGQQSDWCQVSAYSYSNC